ncbi:MAG: 50S ribosomal protein L24 [Acidobacteria bacterium]|nr:MAG: 50S ribosomal protein L24 [Acidobacteriota bacterium]REK02534.1 MAG: 50S ribosomal protein L24 [Acidobacteriota bacterium]REK13663.1 MAG: 50S ribosomal protein L24 [Acidobacteriota bacterium]REK41657.1 MAG: 50S ribosomal protein L24 [Acidobacteriota bacterium]
MIKQKKQGTVRSRIKRGDEVVFISGKEYNRYEKGEDGKATRVPYRGKVIAVDPRGGRVKVEGAMVVSKHQKPVPQMNIEGGIKKLEAWVDSSNVALIDPDTGKPTRVKYELRDGQKVRVAKSGAVIPEPVKVTKQEAAQEEAIKEDAEKQAKAEKEAAGEEE